MKYQTITVTENPTPVLNLGGSTNGDSSTFVNNDIAKSVWIGSNRALNTTDSDTVEIPPLGSAPLDTTSDTYARSAPGTGSVQCLLIPGTGGWTAAPSKIQASLNALGLAKETTQLLVAGSTADTVTTLGAPAQDPSVTALPGGIFTQGVPLYGKRQNVLSVTSHTITAAGVYTSGHIPMSQIGYDLQLITKCSATETLVCPFQLFVEWIDSNSGLIVDQQTYNLAGCDIGNGCGFVFHGPIESDTCQITIFNNGSKTNTITQLDFNSNSVPYRWHDGYSLDEGVNLDNPVNTFTNFDVTNGLISSTSASVPGSGSITRILPLYTGHVFFRMGGGNTGNMQIITQSIDAPVANVIAQLAFVATAQNLDVYLPRSQCLMVLNNTGATATFSVTGTIAGNPEGW